MTDVTDTGSTRTTEGGLIGGLDHLRVKKTEIAGKSHGREALEGEGTTSEFINPRETAAIHLTCDVRTDREKEAMTDDADFIKRKRDTKR